MKRNLLGVNIGGTNCAVIYGIDTDGELQIVTKEKFATTTVEETIARILAELGLLIDQYHLHAKNTNGIGISCEGPLDSEKGMVMSPPNLPGWDQIPIVQLVEESTGIPTVLQNDANAYALAEWKYGAGRGSKNMVFLTFGTGMGAGLILNGALYGGSNDNAGEVGHIRMSDFGPVGYGKAGSLDGFASGRGIEQLARMAVRERRMMGKKVKWCADGNLDAINAKMVAEAAKDGDELAIEIYRTSATYLGKALAFLIDILNPQVIVIGSIFIHAEELIRPVMQAVIDKEALPTAARVCRVKTAELGDKIGDMASLSIAAAI